MPGRCWTGPLERWREVRDGLKYGRLMAFARALPRLRARTAADLRRPGLPREKVLADLFTRVHALKERAEHLRRKM